MFKWIIIGFALLVGAVACLYMLFVANIFENNDKDEKFVTAIHTILPGTIAMDDRDVIDMGQGICEALDVAGPEITQPELVAVITGFVNASDGLVSDEDGGAIAGWAINTYCPEYADDVTRMVATGG